MTNRLESSEANGQKSLDQTTEEDEEEKQTDRQTNRHSFVLRNVCSFLYFIL